MSAVVGCSQCGEPFEQAVLGGGLCRRCLLKLGLDPSQASAGVPGADSDPAFELPRHIGPYRILRLLGEGGMGLVYLAEQEQPLRRRVAVKLIRLGLDTREVVSRFESERQFLAMLSHPHIARVLEAGSTEHGRPYFVMEYVEGERVTDYCDQNRLSIRERLKLFAQICGAVQHAHQRGIIHRDLKPSNLLVEVQSGEPIPKVIDFGVAKATGRQLSDGTLLTRLGAWVGTPAYMSPEQAELSELDVDSRADIYSLGVVLYELLSGSLPFDPDRLRSGSDEEVRRIIREEEPPPPSNRLAGPGPLAARVAGERRTDAAALRRGLRGDLDWIVMKAMEKDRSRRYASASELAGDLVRHLHHEAVTAGPPGVTYRLGKLARRHRVAVAAMAAVFLALVLGVIGTTFGLLRAREAESLASQEARTARAVSDFLVGLFEVSDPGEARGNSVTAREILDDGAEKIRQELHAEPLVRARLLGTMGSVYRKLGLYGEAAPLLEDALQIRESLLEAPNVEVAASLKELGTLDVERGEYERAEGHLQRALATLRQTVGAEDAAVAETLKEIAVLYYRRGDHQRAEPLYEESLELARKTLGPEHPLVAWNLNDLANIYRDREEFERAVPLFQRSLEIHEKAFGPNHAYVANNLNNLANVFHSQGEYERALPLRERSLAIHERVLGPEHPLVATSLSNLALLLQERGDYDTAEAHYQRALALREKVLGPGHPDLAVTLSLLAGLYRVRGLYERAEPLYRRALEAGEAALGSDDLRVAIVLAGLALLHGDRREYERAEPLLLRAIAVFERRLPPRHTRIAGALNALAEVYVQQGRHQEAQDLFERVLALREQFLAKHAESAVGRADLASTLIGLGKLQQLRGREATESWARALEILEGLTPGSATVRFLHLQATVLFYLGRVEEACPMATQLLTKGWQDPEILDLSRSHGCLTSPGSAGVPGTGPAPPSTPQDDAVTHDELRSALARRH